MYKKRVVIRAFTLRRDLLISYMLKKILEKNDYCVEICSSRNFIRTIKLWKPHIIILNTVTQIGRCKEIVPDSKIVIWPGEGANRKSASDPAIIKDKKIDISKIDLVLLWGLGTLNFFKEILPEFDLQKIIVTGNPKLDLIKFNSKLLENMNKEKEKKTIGVLTRHHILNRYNWVPTIFSLTSLEKKDDVDWQVNTFVGTIHLLKKIIKETNYNISLRPHPLESIEGYKALFQDTSLAKEGFQNRITIDNSADVATWCSNQRVIISTSSTSFHEVTLLQIPLINVDVLTNSEKLTKQITPHAAKSQEISYLPRTYEEALKLICDINLKPIKNSEIIDHVENFNNFFNDSSAINKAAREIKKIKIPKHNKLFYIPKFILELIDFISVKRNLKVDPYHYNFSYYKLHHKIPNYISNVIQKIIDSKPVYLINKNDL